MSQSSNVVLSCNAEFNAELDAPSAIRTAHWRAGASWQPLHIQFNEPRRDAVRVQFTCCAVHAVLVPIAIDYIYAIATFSMDLETTVLLQPAEDGATTLYKLTVLHRRLKTARERAFLKVCTPEGSD